MINILQNATRAKQELTRIAIGAGIATPIIALFYLLTMLVKNGHVSGELVSNFFMVSSILFLCWTMGGVYESVKEMKRFHKEMEAKKTERAFERLSGRI